VNRRHQQRSRRLASVADTDPIRIQFDFPPSLHHTDTGAANQWVSGVDPLIGLRHPITRGLVAAGRGTSLFTPFPDTRPRTATLTVIA
jgi:hypothetical protein